MANKPQNTQKTVLLPGGKKQRFATPEEGNRVGLLIKYMDYCSTVHPGITLTEMGELLSNDFKKAIGVLLKVEQGMADRLRKDENLDPNQTAVTAGGPKNASQ